jgi:hypothetical protein
LLVPVLWKIAESKSCWSWLYSNPLRNRQFSWQNWYWINSFWGWFLFFQNFENHSYIPERGLWCFENPKSPRNARGPFLFLITAQHWKGLSHSFLQCLLPLACSMFPNKNWMMPVIHLVYPHYAMLCCRGGSHTSAFSWGRVTWGRGCSWPMENTSIGTTMYIKNLFFSLLLVISKIYLICPFPPYVFEFAWFIPSKNNSMGIWECRNIAGSLPPHNSLGIFCWGNPSKCKEK